MMIIGIISISDRCYKGECEDKSGPAIAECVSNLSDKNEYLIVPDEKALIKDAIISLADDRNADVIFTTGGTGFAPRDITPEATKEVIEKEVPGISEAIRAKSLEITERAMLSRAVSGIRGKTLIINLPGSPKAVRESIAVVLPILEHAVETLSGNTQSCGGNYGK
ncbi:MAG: MogA/MoaB family molybdenum cofactor biosynthesis protein [Clostridia bacterium]|nr:MogA/MoaB family molybdenum cofactor biosynthesis protein [Clostridia bacterium]